MRHPNYLILCVGIVPLTFACLLAQTYPPQGDQAALAAGVAAFGSDPFPDPQVREQVNAFLQQTHSNEGLARLIENPAFETSAEVSGGYTRPTWVGDPSMQLGMENGHQVGGFTVGKSKDDVGSMSMKASFNPDDETITATFNVGPKLKVAGEVRTLQRVYVVKFQYQDKLAFLHALGVDGRTEPGGTATLRVMELLHLKAAETVTVPPETSSVAAAAQRLEQLVAPQIFQSALQFKKVTGGAGWTATLENPLGTGAERRGGFEAAGSRTMTVLHLERLEPGQKPGQGVQFTEVTASVGAGAKGSGGVNNLTADASVGVTFSTDPEKKEAEVGPERRRLAENIRAGRLAEAGVAALQTLAPITQAGRISNAVEQLVQGLQEELPKGVKIQFSGSQLAEMIEQRSSAEDRDGLINLADALEDTARPEARAKLVGEYLHKLKTDFQAGRQTRIPGVLTLVSLSALVTAAEPYVGNWNDLPPELRAPGRIARIVGYQLDETHHDVLLIGEQIPGAPVLTIDDLIVGVRTVWKENGTPFCSLDPDPADIGGDQHVRVGGVPADSGFAQVMLDADYLMKKMGANLETVESAGYESYIDLLRQEARQGQMDSNNRFWFYPCPLQTGDIELSPDGTVVLFNTGVQVLSEQMVLSHEGLLGTGNVDATADRWAAGLTKALPDLEPRHAEFQHLHGLFDLVLLAKTWQRLQVSSPSIERLAALPYQKVELAASYKGLKVEVMKDQALGITYYLMGGVSVRTACSPRAWLVADQPGLAGVRVAAEDEGGSLVRPVVGRGLVLPAATQRQVRTMDVATVLALLRRGDVARASAELQKLIEADPFDPEPWCVRAMIDLQQQAYEVVLTDAGRALELDPDNPTTVMMAASLRFQAHYLTGRLEAALADSDRALHSLPDSTYAHILKGNALLILERIPEARAAYREALHLDPQSVLANVSFGLLEISEGYVVRGKKLVERAQSQMKLEADIPVIKAAMAFAELGVAVLGDTEAHLAACQNYALEVLASPTADPQSRISMYTVQAMLALGRGDLPAADSFVQQALTLAPSNPGPLLLMVGWTHGQKNDDAARLYLARAEKIAPDFLAVKNFRRILDGAP